MQTKRSQGYVVFAFPGMGKTTYALHSQGAIDLDFGNFRSALKVRKEDQHTLYSSFANLIKYYYKDGYLVMTNDQGLIPFVKQFAEGRMSVNIPKDLLEHVLRIEEREKENPINKGFAKLLAENIDQWVKDWVQMADKYDIPVVESRYFAGGYYERERRK